MTERGMRPRRFGVHARSVMGDPRWGLLPLAARAAWLQLTDIADAMPELRSPGRTPADAALLARLLAAERDELDAAISALISLNIIEPVSSGYRLRAY